MRKLVKVAIRFGRIPAGMAALLIVGYAVLNWPAGAKYACVSPSELKTYLDYLDVHVSDPLPFVSQQFRTHDIVLIGEIHRRKQDVEFIKALIPYLYEHNGITIFAWQFGASDSQSEVNSLVNAPEFEEQKAIRLMRRWTYFWNYQEYLDIYHIIWKINNKIPPAREKIRFLQLGSDYIERKYDSPYRSVRKRERIRFAYPQKMVEIMEHEVLSKGKKRCGILAFIMRSPGIVSPAFSFENFSGEETSFMTDIPTGSIQSPCICRSPAEPAESRKKSSACLLPQDIFIHLAG
jgi:hypothetical protein